MRELTGHVVNPANDRLKIEVIDEAGQGGACHRYDITGFDTEKNASNLTPDGYKSSFSRAIILFQNGPIDEDGNGINGLTHEALLEILIDRMKGFQSGQYACENNQLTLECLMSAQGYLLSRTKERMARNVEGTHQV